MCENVLYILLTCVRSHSSSEFEFRRLQLHYSTLRSWYAGCAHSCRGCAVWRLLTNTNEPFWAHYDELALGSTIRRIKQLQWASSSEMLKEFLCIHYSACGGSECPVRCNWSQFATIHRLHSSSPARAPIQTSSAGSALTQLHAVTRPSVRARMLCNECGCLTNIAEIPHVGLVFSRTVTGHDWTEFKYCCSL